MRPLRLLLHRVAQMARSVRLHRLPVQDDVRHNEREIDYEKVCVAHDGRNVCRHIDTV